MRRTLKERVWRSTSARSACAFALVATAMLLLLGGWISGPRNAASEDIVVYLVRHAEQDTVPRGDPVLTERGGARAEALREALIHAGISAIYVSDRVRTQGTVEPLAEALHLTPVVIPVQAGAVDQHIQETARRVRASAAGSTVLVAGHSNTIPRIVNALTGSTLQDLPETVFDAIYVVRLHADGTGTWARLRY